MAKTAEAKRPKPNAKLVDLSRLSQADVCWLLNRRTSWVRERAHVFRRSADKTYDGRRVVEAALSLAVAADLDAESHEGAQQIAEAVESWFLCRRRGAIRVLTSIKDRYGAAGLAAFGEICLQVLNAAEREQPSDKIGEDFLDLLTLYQCDCGRFRFGKEWRDPPLLSGYKGATGESSICPDCEKKKGN